MRFCRVGRSRGTLHLSDLVLVFLLFFYILISSTRWSLLNSHPFNLHCTIKAGNGESAMLNGHVTMRLPQVS